MVAVIFVIVVIIFYVSQDVTDYSGLTSGDTIETQAETTAETSADTAAE